MLGIPVGLDIRLISRHHFPGDQFSEISWSAEIDLPGTIPAIPGTFTERNNLGVIRIDTLGIRVHQGMGTKSTQHNTINRCWPITQKIAGFAQLAFCLFNNTLVFILSSLPLHLGISTRGTAGPGAPIPDPCRYFRITV